MAVPPAVVTIMAGVFGCNDELGAPVSPQNRHHGRLEDGWMGVSPPSVASSRFWTGSGHLTAGAAGWSQIERRTCIAQVFLTAGGGLTKKKRVKAPIV